MIFREFSFFPLIVIAKSSTQFQSMTALGFVQTCTETANPEIFEN